MSRSKGFTLVELMVVVAIAAILARIALPAYQGYMQRTHRTAAMQGLLEAAGRQARYYAATNAYAPDLSTLGYDSNSVVLPSASAPYYAMTASATAATASAPASFSLQAVPQGSQADDVCGTFRYDDLGVRNVSGGSVANCWSQ